MKRLIVIVALLLISAPALAQTISDTRIGVNRLVRDFANEPSTTYLPDSTLNRIIHYAHRTTMMALGKYTNIDIDTIVCVVEQHRYALDANAVSGSIVSVRRRLADAVGTGDVGLVEVDPSLVGKLGEGVNPNSFFIEGAFLVLGTVPLSTDTLFVHYVPVSNNLDADTASVQVAKEDVVAVAYLATSHVYFRDLQVTMGQTYYQLWQQAIALKRREVPAQQ